MKLFPRYTFALTLIAGAFASSALQALTDRAFCLTSHPASSVQVGAL